jgi:hypothetical protein
MKTSAQRFVGKVQNGNVGLSEFTSPERPGRALTHGDSEHYCKVVTSLSETIRLMAAIDAAIPKWPID